MSADLPSLSIVVPVHNEAGNLVSLAAEIRAGLADLHTWECLWVDDASTDASRDELRAIVANDLRHRILLLPEHRGQSAALLSGWHAARCDFVGSVDGDGQNDPADLVNLLRVAVERDLDMVNGVRARRHDSLVRRASSRIANTFRDLVTGDRITDVGCSTRVFRRSFVPHIPAVRSMHRLLPTFVRLAGGRVGEEPVEHRPRRSGRSKYGVWGRLRTGVPDTLAVRRLSRRSVRLDACELEVRSAASTAGPGKAGER